MSEYKHAGGVRVVFFIRAALGVVVDLHFVAVVDRHPFFARLDGDADEDARVVVFIAHAEDHVESAILERAGGPIEQAHAAVRVDQVRFQRSCGRGRRVSSR